MIQPFTVNYIEPVFRPPSEARSLILQVTNGCSWNRCTYCDMYTDPQKKFRPRDEQQVISEIRACAEQNIQPRRIFLADGDALVLSMRRLRNILGAIREYLPDVQRISSYCLPSNLENKHDEALLELKELGLGLIYVGAESGDNAVLQRVDKGETFDSTVTALNRAKQAGLKTSVMLLNGLGGRRYSEQHARESARLVNDTQPDYLATLVLTFYRGADQFEAGFNGEYEALDTVALCQEIRMLLEQTDLQSTIFRSDHASNHLVLKGVLGRDKSRLLAEVDQAIDYFRSHPTYHHEHFGY